MTTIERQSGGDGLWRWFRRIMWGGAAALLVLPAIAMEFTDEVIWTGSDFVFAAVLLFGSAGLIDLAARLNARPAYRAGIVVAVATAFMTLWANAAIGMIGNEENPYNLWFLGVVALALGGAAVARFRAGGMRFAMAAAAIGQATAAIIGMGVDLRGGRFSLIFAGFWLLSAALFHLAAERNKRAAR